jgi:hypothetical protein
MTLGVKVLVVLGAVVALVIVREQVLLTTAPTEITELAVQQMQPSDEAASALRVADRSQNWLSSGWAMCLVLGVLTSCLFSKELGRMVHRGDTEADPRQPGDQGELP